MVHIMYGWSTMTRTFCLFHVFFLFSFLGHFQIKRDETTIESVTEKSRQGKKNIKKLNNNQINSGFIGSSEKFQELVMK